MHLGKGLVFLLQAYTNKLPLFFRQYGGHELKKNSVPALLLLGSLLFFTALEVNLQSNVAGDTHAVGEPPDLQIDESLANASGRGRQSGYQRMPAEC